MDRNTQNLIITILIGLVAGYLAHLLLGGSGLIPYLVSGLLGAVVGPFILSAANVNLRIGNALVDRIATSTIGAIVVVILARLVS